jgi:hypothetical protein
MTGDFMDNKEAVAIIRSNWPDIRYSMLREALDLAIKSLETDDREICAGCICGHYQPTQGTQQRYSTLEALQILNQNR